MDLPPTQRIWNRAVLEQGGGSPKDGDVALAAMMLAHGLIMNGGVLHMAECLSDQERSAACKGYRHFGLEEVANLLRRAATVLARGEDLEEIEASLDSEYWVMVPDDGVLYRAFEKRLREQPGEFAPLEG